MQLPGTALLVADDPQVAERLRRDLTQAGFVVYEARDDREAVRRAEEIAPDVVILDLEMAHNAAVNACRRIRELASVGDVPLLVLSPHQDVTTKVELFDLGADDIVPSSCDPSELVARVREVRRFGAMVAVEFESKAAAKAAISGALERDVLLITCGAHDQAVRFIPALNIAEDDLRHGVRALVAAATVAGTPTPA